MIPKNYKKMYKTPKNVQLKGTMYKNENPVVMPAAGFFSTIRLQKSSIFLSQKCTLLYSNYFVHFLFCTFLKRYTKPNKASIQAQIRGLRVLYIKIWFLSVLKMTSHYHSTFVTESYKNAKHPTNKGFARKSSIISLYYRGGQ